MVSNSLASWAKSSSGLGQLALLDGLDGDGDLGVFAGVLAAGQLRLEGGGLVNGQAGDCLVHALEHGAGADLVGEVCGGVDFLVADLGYKVHGEEVAVGSRAVNRLEGAEAAAQFVQGLGDVVVGSLGGLNGDLEAGVVREFDFGADVQLNVEDQLALVGGGVRNFADFHLGAAHRTDTRFRYCFLVEAVQAVVDGGFQNVAAANALVDEPVGDLALAEARHLHLSGDGLVGLVDARLQFLKRNFDNELYPRGCEVFYSALHSVVLLRVLGLGSAPCVLQSRGDRI